eukprot:6205978-Pleurochrysis_carterae.AAC.2
MRYTHTHHKNDSWNCRCPCGQRWHCGRQQQWTNRPCVVTFEAKHEVHASSGQSPQASLSFAKQHSRDVKHAISHVSALVKERF